MIDKVTDFWLNPKPFLNKEKKDHESSQFSAAHL